MEKQAIKEIMYGSISEMMQNKRFYYRSAVGQQYSHWTEEGRENLFKFVEQVTAYVYDAEQKSLDDRSKAIMLNTLGS